jgi:hypothetical protein
VSDTTASARADAARGTALRRSALACLAAAALAAPGGLLAAPLAPDAMAELCAKAEGTAHCARLIEREQLRRLPNLATRDGATLKVSLYPAGSVSFTDAEALDGGRSYSLFDYLDRINAVLLYTSDGDKASFTLLQRATGRRVELPSEPVLSPDRQRLVTADFCATRCVNELAVWRVTRDGVHKELVWTPRDAWSDAGVTWKSPDTLVVEYTPATGGAAGSVERRLTDAGWRRLAPP